MSEHNMKNVRRLLEEVWTQGNLSVLPQVMTDDAISHAMPNREPLRGRDRYQELIALYKGTFIETSFTVEEQFASGDKVATRWTAKATEDSAAVQHDKVTGEPITITGISITHHGSDGKITEGWDTWDTLNLLQSTSAPNIFEQLSMTL